MKWHISSWLFTKLDDFLLFGFYKVEWSFGWKKLCFLLVILTEIRLQLCTKPCRIQFEDLVYSQKWLLYSTYCLNLSCRIRKFDIFLVKSPCVLSWCMYRVTQLKSEQQKNWLHGELFRSWVIIRIISVKTV